MNEDIRWKQKLQIFSKAFDQLEKMMKLNSLNEFEEQGLIQYFKSNFELSWNVIKDFYEYQGEISIQGSRDAFRLAYKQGLIENGDIWMDMIKNRALTIHAYERSIAEELVESIRKEYYLEFSKLIYKLRELAK